METDGSLICSATIEWLNTLGVLIKKRTYKTAVLRLTRNNFRDMFVEVRADKGKEVTRLQLKGVRVLNRYMSEGKSSIIFNEVKCTMLLSNAPPANLINFMKIIFIKMTGQTEQSLKNPLREKLLSNKSLGGVQEISPATIAEIDKAKEKASSVSRVTTTTPSPSNSRKRKLINQNTPSIPKAKKLYANPTIRNLTAEQNKVLEMALSQKNIFFTGSAGTGKSFLLKRIIAALPPDTTIATASTGVAACHIGGITLHQFAGIGLGHATLDRCFSMASQSAAASTWRKIKHLVIDEISMVDGDYFDKIEAVARHVRKNDRPFGGIQLILCGDFLQLPPVSKQEQKAKFCFESEAWKKCVHFSFELQQVHRQKDPAFVKILNSIRIGRVTEDIANTLKATSLQKIENDGILATRLCSHINEANAINNSQLACLPGESQIFMAQDSDPMVSQTLDKQLPVPGRLELKVGAQVMLLKNINIANGLVNGARGVIVKFVDDVPLVHFRAGEHYLAKMEKWSIKSSGGSMFFRKQIPLKLAWAFSIHKSQGLTLDCVEMSLGRVFDSGQAYVALSRAQSLQSLRVLDFNVNQVWANTTVLEFYKRFRRNLQQMDMIPLGRKMKSANKL
ncbi:ATP-dependent DNA helicase PIF1 [Cephus cinctus]|uniref:ATP-dependent DNA helicase PIF1 n=1 Tax=Cephus cinctus TaxID=211228 RepID=A0AAJ7RRF3_CEPCN|nr:ATP-dependent DNA helicase PIF1 [Cephus cinctus]XP_015605452.1 ATP-dependent DNA helicase PIF1 [Cephus cinctus]XP_024945672.1 ATP-dependent DNA helicase PIF1 [Cephus cinctus]XP_024945673.1 ATP-dependent DNA helicase PIF1 [Cephus cinctus]